MSDFVKNAVFFMPNIGSAVNLGLIRAGLIGTLVVVVCLIILLIIRRKGLDKGGKKLGATLLCLLMAVLLVANVAIYRYSSVLDIWFTGFTQRNAEMNAAIDNSLAQMEKVMEEGAVLLRNENNTLPLDVNSNPNINLFGIRTEKLIYTNHFNGDVNWDNRISLTEAFEKAGFVVNGDLMKFYQDKASQIETQSANIFAMRGGNYNIAEVPAEEIDETLISSAVAFSDTAIVTIARASGEGADLAYDMAEYEGGDAGKHYLELQDVERGLLKLVSDNFDKVIVLVNSASPMEMGFLEEFDIDAALWIANPGDTGCEAVAKILAGEVNPSGRTVDTWAYDATSAPSYYNLGDFSYTNANYTDSETNSFGRPVDPRSKFIDYAEGIYVDYRYYETRWIDNETGECDEDAYHAAVQYPFGYGLSYTTFEKKIAGYSSDDKNITLQVEVTNTGDTAGKDVAEIYYTAPYTIGGIEKSHVVLVAFDKTGLLQPGESETLTLTFAIDDMASYDYAENRCYVLEEGDYEIKLMNNSHDVIDSVVYTVDATKIFNEENDGARSTDKAIAVNQFDDTTYGEEVKWVSRADWEGTLPKAMAVDREAPAEIAAKITNYDVVYEDTKDASEFSVVDHGITLDQMVGLDYDDPKWNDFMEQVTVDDMVLMVGYGGWQTPAIAHLGVPNMNCVDGPGGIDNYVNNMSGCSWLAQCLWATTWDEDFVEETAEVFGAEFAAFGYDGIYGGGNNIHRSPFSGRNFEYFSADGLQSGKMAAATVRGVYKNGVIMHLKHFAVNDQETNRNINGVCTWANEQALREIYLKAFEVPAKESPLMALMGSFNRIGSTWAEGYSELNRNVLRDEWGFHGLILTDANVFEGDTPYMGPDILIYGGGNLNEATTGYTVTEQTTGSYTGLTNLREAMHGVFYTIANSSAMYEKSAVGLSWWPWIQIGADAVILLLILLGIIKMTSAAKVKVE